jgi:hypothetical protein
MAYSLTLRLVLLLVTLLCIDTIKLQSQSQFSPRPPEIKPNFPNNPSFVYPYNYRHPKPKYVKHAGIIYFKNGTLEKGEIKIKKKNIEFTRESNGKKYKIELNTIDKIIIKGADKNVEYRSDSTEIIYFANLKAIYRKIIDGRYCIYDNSFNIDENTYLPEDYNRICTVNDSVTIKIGSYAELRKMGIETEYLKKLEEITCLENFNNLEVEDFIRGQNAGSLISYLKWDTLTLYYKTGEVVNYPGMIHPYKDCIGIDQKANVHLFDGKSFLLVDSKDIDSIKFHNNVYTLKVLNINNDSVFVHKWNYLGEDYYVAHLLSNDYGPSTTFLDELFMLDEFETKTAKNLQKKRSYLVNENIYIVNRIMVYELKNNGYLSRVFNKKKLIQAYLNSVKYN